MLLSYLACTKSWKWATMFDRMFLLFFAHRLVFLELVTLAFLPWQSMTGMNSTRSTEHCLTRGYPGGLPLRATLMPRTGKKKKKRKKLNKTMRSLWWRPETGMTGKTIIAGVTETVTTWADWPLKCVRPIKLLLFLFLLQSCHGASHKCDEKERCSFIWAVCQSVRLCAGQHYSEGPCHVMSHWQHSARWCCLFITVVCLAGLNEAVSWWLLMSLDNKDFQIMCTDKSQLSFLWLSHFLLNLVVMY